MALRSIPPRTSTGRSPVNIVKRFSEILPETKKAKILTGIRGRVLGNSFNLGNPEAFNFGIRSVKRYRTKAGTVRRKIKSHRVKVEKNNVMIDKFNEKDKFKIIVSGTNQYALKDDILSIGEKDEILLPRMIDLNTIETEEKNGILVITFKKQTKRKNET